MEIAPILPLQLLGKSGILKNLNSKLFRFHCVRPNIVNTRNPASRASKPPSFFPYVEQVFFTDYSNTRFN